LNYPTGLAFNSAGNLLEVDNGSGNIYEFTPNGGSSTFASGLVCPWGLAFDNAGNLFEANCSDAQNIYEFTSNGGSSTFASRFEEPTFLAFQGITLPVPEPSTWALVGAGVLALLALWSRKMDRRSFTA
jgi:DNA-binding beta-propeller fold protein YncE